MRRAVRGVLVAGGSLVVALAALELALRVAAAFAPGTRPAPAPDGRPVVLFLGDSNMYGLNVGPEETLPAQAETLSRAGGARGFASVNRGRIGHASWLALDEARDAIPKHRPAAVVVRVGINNRHLVTPDDAGWYERLRVVRLARIGLRNLRDIRANLHVAAASRPELPPAEDVPERWIVQSPARDGGPADPFALSRDPRVTLDYDANVRPRLRRDLVDLAREAASAGARVVFASYLDDAAAFADPNADLAWAARETGSSFADLSAVGRRALAVRRREELVFEDHHATGLGYRLEAQEVVRALVAAGAVSGETPADPLEWLATLPPSDVVLVRRAVRGTVNMGAGSIVPVLLANGDAGDELGRVSLRSSDPLRIELRVPPAGPASAPAVFFL
ncbi:MAG TPA: SGNH/GDSL hydrolase family protein, partial [Planctomycetota bacterium]|nr:SGNH/GDSL hydrolase family protein [Planctomycetota bacterium]